MSDVLHIPDSQMITSKHYFCFLFSSTFWTR